MYPDTATGAGKAFMDAYKAKYNADAPGPAQIGFVVADIFIEGLKRAGKDLTPDALVKALESINDYKNPFAPVTVKFSATSHLGAHEVFLTVVEKGRWKTLESGLSYK
jgi:ABC-type branched-subunit amino acid transport system substrate-binding protein